jgi:hypothetical protein
MARLHHALATAELRERCASLEADCAAYRDLAQQAIHVLNDVVAERDRLRWRVREQQQQIRTLLQITDARRRHAA